ncbi:MAG: L-serine ammonia-lyase, iron-sulfur-dependent, subunit alpha [Bacilli bacterium]|nr:L-serine ammonia-lyase, iron-sulfur-dependent, subunit alpha [Bacilli bacterium]
MRSIKEIFVIGYGPSSSHTMGPANACEYILKEYKDIKSITVTLFGSLALTGKGHLTDYIIDLKFKDIKHKVLFDSKTETKHPNTMEFEVTTDEGTYKETIVSIGGGTIVTKHNYDEIGKEVYPHRSLKEILAFCDKNNLSLKDYVKKYEEADIYQYLKACKDQIISAIDSGLAKEGTLPGPLKVQRKAKEMMANLQNDDPAEIMAISAFAVAEENASGNIIVIAPTCGSAGVFGGILGYFRKKGYSEDAIIDSLMVAGLIGILAKTNACVSGAEAGCQAEIGVACAMGAAAIANIKGLNNEHIARAAEIALEHSLGLTCDPVQGYVQIPCIERCAVYALKAKNAAKLATLIPSSGNKIGFDESLKTMYETGKDLSSGYRETGKKGLGEIFK